MDIEKRKELTRLTFAKNYQGGHPMRDPDFIRKYKEARKVAPHYDKDKARSTCLERYGVESYAQTDRAREISHRNMLELQKSGKAFSGKNIKECPDVQHLRDLCAQQKSSVELSEIFGVSTVTMTRWFKEYGIVRDTAPAKRMPAWSESQLIGDYRKACEESGKTLSFPEYGKHRKSQALCLRLQRLCKRKPEIKENLVKN
jgi:hypothetical protein